MTDSPANTSGSKAGEDLYAEFLDLPSGDRPPHYYQLLLLELFCSHPERIQHASRKQFRRIKPFEDHPDHQIRQSVQDIMTQIATARVVLCNHAKKQDYDQALAEQLGINLNEYLQNRLAAPVPDCFLRITAGPEMVGHRIDLVEGRRVTIGSDPQCMIALPSIRVSKAHCQLDFRDRDWLLKPISKERATLVNDTRIKEFVLDEGDVIDLGGYRLRFGRLPENVPTDPTPPPISLIVRKGPSIGYPTLNVLPPETILIGTCDTATWQLVHPLISRHHCRLEPKGKDWQIKDLQSKNGITINGKQVDQGTLNDHDELVIGPFEILVSLRK